MLWLASEQLPPVRRTTKVLHRSRPGPVTKLTSNSEVALLTIAVWVNNANRVDERAITTNL